MKLHCFGRLLNWFARYQAFAVVASGTLLALAATGGSKKGVQAGLTDLSLYEHQQLAELSFVQNGIAILSQSFDDCGFPVLDIALLPDATQRLQAETLRLLNTDVIFALSTTPLFSARLVEPIAEGNCRLGARFSLIEAQDMARQIICALRLSADQYDPSSLSGNLPCKLDKRQGAK